MSVARQWLPPLSRRRGNRIWAPGGLCWLLVACSAVLIKLKVVEFLSNISIIFTVIIKRGNRIWAPGGLGPGQGWWHALLIFKLLLSICLFLIVVEFLSNIYPSSSLSSTREGTFSLSEGTGSDRRVAYTSGGDVTLCRSWNFIYPFVSFVLVFEVSGISYKFLAIFFYPFVSFVLVLEWSEISLAQPFSDSFLTSQEWMSRWVAERGGRRCNVLLITQIYLYFHRSGSSFKVFVFFWLTQLLYVLCVLCFYTIFSHMEPHFWVQLPINVENKSNLSQLVLKSLRVWNPAAKQKFILLCRIFL